MQTKTPFRYPELDIWRGLAIIGMVIMHIAVVEAFISSGGKTALPIAWGSDALIVLGRLSAISFLLLVGMSGAISFWRRQQCGDSFDQLQKYFLIRGLKIFGFGLLVTVVTWLVAPDAYIRFGILHLIGASVLLLPFFMHRLARFGGGLVLVILAIITKQIGPVHEIFILLGQYPPGFKTLDIFPFFPWLIVVFVGIELAEWLYPQAQSKYAWSSGERLVTNQKLVRYLAWIGQQALLIYLIHIPIIFVIIFLTQWFF